VLERADDFPADLATPDRQVPGLEARDRIKLCLVDPNTVTREGLRALAEGQPDFSVVGAGASTAMVATVCETPPDVVVSDIDLPDGHDAGAVAALQQTFSEAALVVLTSVDNPNRVRQVLDAGVDGYMLKCTPPGEFFFALRAVARCESYVQPSLRTSAVSTYRTASPRTVYMVDLTAKEAAVLELLARGYTNREIAEQRRVSIRTVESQRSRIIDKTGMRSRAELVRHAHALGLVDTPRRVATVGSRVMARSS
jgi:two-component system, NarL family, response regulator NreC